MELHAPCSCRASTVLLCASGASHTQAHWPPLALTLHFARCVYAHLPQLHPHRPSGFRRRTSLCRSYRRCFLFYDHADGISTRRDQIFSWYSPWVSSHRHGFPLCPVHRHAPAKDFLCGSHSRTENSLHFTSSGAHLSLSAAAYGRYERGYHSQKQATPGFSLGDH